MVEGWTWDKELHLQYKIEIIDYSTYNINIYFMPHIKL